MKICLHEVLTSANLLKFTSIFTLGLFSYKISYFTSSRRTGFTETVWVRTLTDDCMPGLERDLVEASQLTVETLYENAPGPMEDGILGKGE